MERLTKPTVGTFKYSLKDHEYTIGEFTTYDAFFDFSMAAKRLGEYEDSGLEPEEIKQTIELLKDATNKYETSVKMHGITTKLLNEYKDLEEQGIFIKLPCKVGDTIWLADFDRELSINAKQSVQPLKVCFFRVTDANITIVCETQGESWYYVHPLKLGKTVFLTKKEAENALKGAEN